MRPINLSSNSCEFHFVLFVHEGRGLEDGWIASRHRVREQQFTLDEERRRGGDERIISSGRLRIEDAMEQQFTPRRG